MYRVLAGILCALLLTGCAADPHFGGDRDLTVGTVQREIRVGMSGAEVAEALGSPNIVSTDEDRNEVWIYDKISTRSVETESRGATATLRFIDYLGPIAASGETRRKGTSQRTLTVIIKFDDERSVRDFAYHTSRF
jgi:outer membrane protein assembly factor BamE (lipoprotein component of BamABCDE complex)